MPNGNRKKLFNALNSAGFDIGSYDDFDRRMNNADDRAKFYDAVQAAGYDIGGYADFDKRIRDSKYALITKGRRIPVSEKEYTDFMARHPRQGGKKPASQSAPKSATPRQQPAKAWQQQMSINVGNSVRQTIQTVNQRQKNVGEYLRQRMQRPLKQQRVQLGRKSKGAFTTPSDSKNLEQGGYEYNPETGKFEPTYITSVGNKYNDIGVANMEQRQIDDFRERELRPVETELRDAYAEQERLNKMAQERIDQIEADKKDRGFFQNLLIEAGHAANSDKMPDATSPHHDWDRDSEYTSLMTALRKNKERITTLEDARDKKTNSFWHSFGTEIANGYTFSFGGKARMDDVVSLQGAQRHVDSINKKRQKGLRLTHEEEVAEAVLKNAAWDADVQAKYGDQYGAWARAGKMGAVSADFMLDFLMAGGAPASLANKTMQGVVKGGTKLLGNYAMKGLGKYMVKGVGATVGSLAAGATISNTVQLGKTMADAGQRMLGDVVMDENGNYKFGHYEDDGKGGVKFVEGGGTFLGAVLKAERSAIAENASEIAGEFIPGGGQLLLKGMEKIGLSKIAGGLTALSGKSWYKAYSKVLETAGFHGVAGEGLEEYAGFAFDAMMGGDDWKSMGDPRTHVDIWLGCATMGALLNAPRTIATGYTAAQQMRYKHLVNNADKTASARLGENWEQLRGRIDATTNEQMTDVVLEVMNSEDMSQDDKRAVLDYVKNLQSYRGFSLGRVAAGREEDSETPAEQFAHETDQAYTEGYNISAGERHDAVIDLTEKRNALSDALGDEVASKFENDPQQALRDVLADESLSDEQKQAAMDFATSRAKHDGMMRRIGDEADEQANQQRETSKQMQHSDGSIRPATLKEKDEEGHDKQVYVVDGNVQMLPDGTMVDAENSDKSVVVYNPATGKREIIDPTSDTGILTLGEVETAEQRETAIQKARDQYVQRMMDEARGTVRLDPGQQITLPTGEEAVVAATDGDNATVTLGDGSQTNVSLAELQRIKDEEAMADYRQRHGIEQEQPTNTETFENYAQNQPENIPEGEQPIVGEQRGGAPQEYTPDMELTIRDEDGTEKPAMVMGRVRYEGGQFVPDEGGNIVEYYMDGEVQHDRIGDLDGKVVNHRPAIEEQREQPAVAEQVNNAPENIPQQQAAAPQGEDAQLINDNMPPATEQPIEPAAQAPVQEDASALEPMPMKEDGEEDYYATTPERAHSYIFNEAGLTRSEATAHVAAQADAANKALVKAKSQQMPSIGTSIKKFNEAKAKRQAKIDEARRAVDYWQRVRDIQNEINRHEAAERAAIDAQRHNEAVAQAQADYEARKAAEAERKAVGNENPMPAITEKWNTATKVDGHKDEMVLPDGEHLKGHYVLHEAGVSSPSHNSETWAKTEGFPMDSNDNSVNDRDYERDRDAQQHTGGIAQQYDSRALQNVPVVSNDGVVLSGNGRTMAGEIAARRGTDGAYLDYLKEYAHKFGFTPGQVEQMRHPRVAFVPDDAMPYTADTFAKFNQQEMKSQNKTEQAVKLGKTVSDDSFGRIVRTINGYDTLGDFYNDPQASLGALYGLHGAGVIPQAQMAEMVDGMKGQERLSAVGREFLENMLIGKAFGNNPEVVRMLTAVPGMRQTVITALGEISDNIALGEDWSLQYELADAVKLVFNARNDGGYQHGDIVSVYARQGKLFADPGELQTVADFNNATMLMLADVLNDKRVTMLKKTLTTYNDEARQSASGQMDIFSGVVKSREDILRDVINYFKHANKGEYEQRLTEAVERRKAESVQQDGVAPPVDGEEPAGDGSERRVADDGGDVARQGDLAETKELKYQLSDEIDENGLPFVLSPDGEIEFGRITADTGLTEAPILLSEGMITAPATNAGYGLIHIEARHGEQIRSAGYKSVVDFINEVAKNYEIIREGKDRDGNQTYLLQLTDKHNNTLIVELSGDGTYWNINTAGIFKTSYGAKRNVVYNRHTTDKQSAETAGVSLSEEQSGTSSETSMNTPTQETSVSSEGKGSEISATDQTNSEEIAENKQPSEETAAPATVQEQVEAAAAETNTEPTPAQREAGNYKKGHVTIGDFDITIENPAGSERKGVDADGKPWSVTMRNTYGYIKGTEGVDGDHIDVFLAEDMDEWDGRKVFVVDQTHEDGSFNEHKVMLGFNGMDEALEAYASNYEKGWLQSHPGIRIRGVNIEDFNKWVQSSHRKTKPFAEYVTMKPTDETEIIQARNDGYTIDKQSGILKNADAFVVNFNERADKDTWRGQTAIAKKFGGYYKRGKGFVFRTEEAAHDFAETAMGRSADEVKDEAPLSVNEVAAAAGGEQATGEQPKQEEKKSKSKWVNDEDAERFEELRKRLRQKLGGQLNMGIDPEAFAIGVEMSYLMLKKGARKFHEFAKNLIEALGEEVRPYIKSFYNGARDLPEMAEFEEEMTPYDEVRKFDIANFDNQGAKDIVATAEHVVREQAAEREAQEATDKLKAQRNEQRKEIEQQVAADTETAASKATAVASEVESKLPTARTEREVNDLTRQIDDAIAKVDDQLAVLGYYEAEPVESDFNEAYGYKRNAEKKAVKDITRLGKRLAEALGISDITLTDAKGNKVKNVHANIAPAGGDITLRLPLRDGVELYMDFSLTPADEIPGRSYGENLRLTRILFRPERGNDYLRANNFFNGSETMAQMLHGIRAVCKDWLPVEDYVDMAARIASEAEVNKIKEIAQKGKKSPKKSVSSQKKEQPVIGDLFASMFDEATSEPVKPTSNEKEVQLQSRPGTPDRKGGHQRGQNEPLGEGKQHEDERTDTGRVAGRSGNDTVSDTAGGSRVSEPSDGQRNVRPAKPEPAPLAESERKNTHNNHAERGTDYAPKSTSARIEANIKAIETMQRLIESGEPATPEDMVVLRKFSGWGGLGAAFNEMEGGPYGRVNMNNKRLRELLSPEAYEAANMSRNSAYFTPAAPIDAMWDVARAMGFRGGNVLEGSAGIGNILGLMPTDMSERSNIHAVEIDETTGNILKLLYPDANVEIKGFEKTFVPNGSVDLAITNVPFVTGLRVMDETGDKDLAKKFHDIHDFCIAKNVRKLKEGGIGIFITSSGTLDSPNSAKLRNWLVNEGNADVAGAFRMHNQTFGGTGATSDIIVIRKRVNGRKSANAIDVSGTLPLRTVKYNTGETKRGSSEVIIKDLALDVNKHFVEHPEDMAGEMAFAFEKGETYRATSKALYPSKGINQEQRLAEWAQQFKDMDWDKAEERESIQVVYEDLGEGVKEGSMLLDSDGNLCLAQRGKAVPIGVNSNKVKGHTKAECFNAYKAIKDALADVLEYQTTHSDDKGLKQKLDALNRAYDAFVKTYGHLNKNTAISFLRSDMDYPSIAALESVSETGDKSGKRIVTYGKTDIFTRRVVETESEPKPTTIKDGIIASIYLNGRVDVPYIAEQLGMSEADMRSQIVADGLGFENPTTTEMEVSYEYLSGNVREKLRQAQENNTDGRYDANIKALERIMPMNIPAHLIEFTLGSSWVEPKLYEDFVKERTGIDVKLTNAGGTWIMSEPYWTNTEQNKAMGVISEKCDKTILGHELIKAAITCKSISVTKTITSGYGSHKTTETIVDKEATMACANKIDEIRQDFKDWARGKMQGAPEMSERMERVYNDLFNNSVPKEIPDEFVPDHFGGAATVVNGKPFKLRPHQAKAVIRATTQPLMLAHEVGTGKTYTLISTAMEMRRLGTARKPMIVVQNATVGQFVASAKALYPNAKILTLEDADRNAEGRRNFYAKIRYNDWDMIVVPQSVFERIPDSEERQIRFIEDKVEEKMMVLEKMREAATDDRDPVLRQAQRELEQLNDELNDLQVKLKERREGKTGRDEKREAKTKQNAMVKAQEMLDRETDDVANFDDMGIDALLIDEAHEYKHLGFVTAMQRGVKGVDPSYSKKSQGVYLKTQAVLENKNGKNVVFATGTPISNTAAEIWTFMRYLMPADTMREYGIYYFDDFVRNFGNIQQMLEFSTSGKYKENNRFAGYVNLPELVRIWAGVADTVLTREAGGVSDKIPRMEGDKAQDIYLPQTKALRGVMKFVKDQLDEYEQMSGKEKKENSHIPLVMYGIAKAAAVDARLVLEDAADEPNSKTNEAVRQTLCSLEDTKEYNGTVAIFADNYQNKSTGFNLYEDIRKKLIDAGVPETQVVVMKSGMSIKKKLELFDKVNRGDVRVIMGSTFTLGTGVNIQERLHTLIHVDAPNRPMDYTQRNGRILRQGNLHNEWGIPVRVLRFGVEDSLDVTAYQRLKTKGAIADSIMEGKKMMGNSMENRVLEEEQDLFGDITAQLSGSQYALLKSQVEKEVKKLEARKKQWEADQTYVHNQKPRLKALIKDAEERAGQNKDALAKVEAAKMDGITIGKQHFANLDAMADYIKDYNKKQRERQEQVRTASSYDAKTESDLTVNIGGLDFHVHSTISKESKKETGQLSLSFAAKTKMTYSCPELGLEEIPVDGQRLKSALEEIVSDVMTGDCFREKIEYAERAAERYKGELKQVEARDGKPFEYADELKQAKEKLAEYEELMKAEMADKEAKYAEMDASVEAATGVQLSDEDSEVEGTDNASYRLREDAPPTKTGIGYKVFVLKDGKLYPPMVANPNGEATPVGVWLDADAAPIAGQSKTGRPQVAAGGKGTQGGSGKLAYRPGWHLGEIPYALQFNRLNPGTGEKELFPANFVWAEVEYANDVDYQEEAMSYGMKPNGKFQHSLAGLPRLPENGAYRYRTNPNPETDPWIITGAMKVNRVLTPSEVDEMVEAAGREPQQRQAGAVTDEQITELNKAIAHSMQEDTDMKRKTVEQMGAKLNTPITIIEDGSTYKHANAKIQARRRRAKGWYDRSTGEVVVVLSNNRDVEDAAATVGHEVIGHKGLRELVGEERYGDFLDEVYNHLRDDLKKQVDERAGTAFLYDTAENNEKAKSYDEHRREQTDELIGDMAQKPFDEFTDGERTLWQKMCHIIRRLLDKFLGSLKLPKWFTIGDNEIRYMLWRSKERLERGKEHPIDFARDMVKREELGLTDEARYNMGDKPETFAARQRRAVEQKGVVMSGLNSAEVKVVGDIPRHPYTGSIAEATRQAIDAAKAKYAPNGEPRTLHYNNFGAEFDYSISGNAIETVLSSKHQGKSVNKGVHLALAEHLDRVIGESIEVEEHPDRLKTGNERDNRKINPDALMHRFYGVARVDGTDYRVMTLMKEESRQKESNGIHSYEVQKIEVLDEETPNTSNGVGTPNSELEAYPLAKVIQNVDKTMESGKKLLDESKLADEDAALYREGEDLSNLRLRPLADGEVCHLERRFNEDKSIQLTGSRAKIKSIDDVAYLFRSLEDKAVEHSFLALVKDGRATVIHTGMGNATSTIVDSSSLAVLLDAIQPDKVYFVHNHPSGSLKPSSPDLRTAENIEKMLDGRVPLECLIIDSYRHEYVSFDGLGTETYAMPEERTSNRRVQLYTFDQHVFDKDWKPSTISSAHDIAGFVASERLGERDKVCCLVLNNRNGIVGNLCPSVVSLADLDKEQLQTLVRDALLMGGKSLAFYGNNIDLNGTELSRLGKQLQALSGGNLRILDALNLSRGGNGYTSAMELGRLYESEPIYNEAHDDDVPRAIARAAYERMVSSAKNQFAEAVQDSMLSLKNLYKAILDAEGKSKNIEDVASYENAYLAENRMASMSEAQVGVWHKDYMEPLIKEVSRLAPGKMAYEKLTDYMMAKHGLERNEVLARRDAERAASEKYDARIAELDKAHQDDPPDEAITDALDEAKRARQDFLNSEAMANRERDYAGLTALTGKEEVADAELEARRMVDDYEQAHETDALWKAVNAATRSSLYKIAESGMMSADRHRQVRDMFEYYIPLQGFDEKAAEDMYAYMGSDGTLGYGTPIRSAKGRKSKADDPVATIQMNGEAAIRQGNRNVMKQRFLNFVQAHPSDLVSVSDVWLRHNDVTGEWEQTFDAGLKEDDRPEDVERKVRDFEERMEQLAKSDPDHYKRGSDVPNIPYRVVKPSNERQHQVLVQRGGKSYVLTINGNPRAAQALNGLTNPDVETEGIFGKAMNIGAKINRLLSSFYTTRNPEFVVSNYIRDAFYSNSMMWIKEAPNYAMKFHKNFGKLNPVMMGKMFAEWESGSLREKVLQGGTGETAYIRRMFYDFMMNGGETGWTNLRDIERHKRDLEKSLKLERSASRRAWKALGGCLDLMNRAVENNARFAAYMTSREMGRSVERSIWDAKEVSVNFNKKGAGDKFLTAKNQTLLGQIGAATGGLGRGLFLFWNASTQGLQNIGKQAKRHPAKFAGLATTLFVLGAVAPLIAEMLSGGDDDDKDSYYNLPEYVRRSNLVFRWSAGMPWITLPLPIEFRAIYGMGELVTGMLTGKERYSNEEFAKQFTSQMSQVLPLDFMEGGGGWHAFVPSSIKPFVEAQGNTSWTGLPIYRDNKFKPYDPQWKRAYDSANRQIVTATKWLNEATGGDDATQGFIDWNPASIEYMLKGYLGGYFTMYDRLQKTAETAFGDRKFEWRNMPVASRVLKNGDERTAARKLTNEYFNLLDEYERTDARLKGYKKIVDEGGEDALKYAERIDYLHNSEEYKHYLLMDYYKPLIDTYHDMGNEAEGSEQQRIKQEENALRREFVDLIHAVDEGKETDLDATILQMLEDKARSGDVEVQKKAVSVAKNKYYKRDGGKPAGLTQ